MYIAPKPLSAYPWYLRPFYWRQRRRYGQVLLPGLIWGRVPRLFMAVALLYGALDARRSRLDPVLRSLVTVRVSQLNWCRFCVDLNAAVLSRRAGSEAKVAELDDWRHSGLFNPLERLALEYAEAMTLSDQRVSPELMARLRGVYSDEALVELTALIAFQNLSSKFNAALDVPAQGFCATRALPDRPATRSPPDPG